MTSQFDFSEHVADPVLAAASSGNPFGLLALGRFFWGTARTQGILLGPSLALSPLLFLLGILLGPVARPALAAVSSGNPFGPRR